MCASDPLVEMKVIKLWLCPEVLNYHSNFDWIMKCFRCENGPRELVKIR